LSLPRVLPVGDAAVTVELGDDLSLATNARVRALDRALRHEPLDGVVETVPTLRSLLVLYDPAVRRFETLAREVLGRVARAVVEPALEPRLHEVPTVYGGEDGPDLEAVASGQGLAPAALVALHSSCAYTVLMLGFTPGFAYSGLLPDPLDVPRLATPRLRVPAGSVAVAGRLTGVYPSASAGGWPLVGRTSVGLFDPQRAEPSLFGPGDRVRFVPVAELPATTPPAALPTPAGAPVVEVLEPGLLTTVQDGHRDGHRRFGVSGAGPLDPRAHAAANRAVGNGELAPALECTITGPTLLFLAPVRFAVAGADLGAVLERSDLGPWPLPRGAAVLARPGNVLRFRQRLSGCRATVAIAGGLDVSPVLGSASTDVVAGLGGLRGRPLVAGDRLGARPPRGGSGTASAPWPIADRALVRVVLGPQADHLAPESLRTFFETSWRVSTASDRVGLRLEGGEPLRHRHRAEILSDGMVPGAVQVPPDGRPIVMAADSPTTGGYPKVATVVTADQPLLAQLLPGAGEVRFEAVRVEDVQP
jgi:KipI family sensor histidine kinase inhibitor